MKRYILKLALLALSAGTLISCDEDTVTYGGTNFVTFDKVASTRYNFFENGGVSKIPVNLAFPKSNDITVTFTVTSTVAVAGVDYNVLSPGSIVIPAGQTTGYIEVEIINNEIMNDSKTLDITLTSVNDTSVSLGINDVASTFKKFLIINDDCTTNFIAFIGRYNSIDTETQNVIGSADVDVTETGECNLLNISGVLDNRIQNETDSYITFVLSPAGSNKNSGSLKADQQLYCEECYPNGNGGQETVSFAGGGSFVYSPNATDFKLKKRLLITGNLYFASSTAAVTDTSVRLEPVE